MDINDKWRKAREDAWNRCLTYIDGKAFKGPPCSWVDHGRWFAKDGRPVLFDNPYIPSEYLEQEYRLLALGWRIEHLPLHMSWYVAGKCQPRLLAPPNSKADLDFLSLLLSVTGYEGNFKLTKAFAKEGHYCGGPEWQTSFADQINEETV
jgi:hypothetical protein